jgi:endoglucanase
MSFASIALALLPHLTQAVPDSIAPDQSSMGTLTATEYAKGMRIGWNIGNTLDAVNQVNGFYVPGETNWGNPMITQTLIDSVKAAGFNAIRLPVAWSKFSDSTTFTIDTNWLHRVQQVVDYAIGRDMYVMLNEHWDGGWADNRVYADSAYANKRLRAIWKQVGKRFRDYGSKLMFAGTNEVRKDNYYGTPTTEALNVQMGYNQLFVKAIRATGGRNTYRYLVVQAYNTNIDHAVNYLKLPTDPTSKRLMVEVHFYDPYEFTISTDAAHTAITQWGAQGASAKKATWGDESNVDAQFAKMKTAFGDKGAPVVIGEYGCIQKNTSDNPAFRVAWDKYVTGAAVKLGLVPFYWDNGGTGTSGGGMGLFDRSTGKQAFPDIVKAMVSQAPVTVGIQSGKAILQTWARLEGGNLTVHLEAVQASAAQICNVRGQVVKSLFVEPGTHSQSVSLPAGAYILQLQTPQGTMRQALFQTP